MARWARTKTKVEAANTVRKSDVKAKTSDESLLLLLNRLKKTSDLKEIRRLSDQIERVIFHKQFANA